MFNIGRGTFTLCCLLGLASACGAGKQWHGDYGYQAVVGNTTGGSPISVEYRLQVGGNDRCRLAVNGYQVSEVIACEALPVKERLEVRFRSYADGSLTNVYDVQVYKPNEALFVLSEKSGQLLTHWKAMSPAGGDGGVCRCFSRRRAAP